MNKSRNRIEQNNADNLKIRFLVVINLEVIRKLVILVEFKRTNPSYLMKLEVTGVKSEFEIHYMLWNRMFYH